MILQTHLNLSRLSIGDARTGTRVERVFQNDGKGNLVEQPAAVISGIETPGSDSQDPLPVEPVASISVSVQDLSALVIAANNAAFSLDRFVQLHDPLGVDLKHLEELRTAIDKVSGLHVEFPGGAQ